MEVDIASLTIRNLDDEVKRKLRIRAAEQGRSMEEEARAILREAVEVTASEGDETENWAESIHRRFAKHGGVELELPPREPPREPPSFD